MKRLPNLPVGQQYFRNIIEDDGVYVDKTQYIYELCRPLYRGYFLSRPRRFGKSQTLDTMIVTADRIFLFEFKMNETAEAALQSIKDRRYAESLRYLQKPVTGIGVSFSVKTKGVEDWKAEDL